MVGIGFEASRTERTSGVREVTEGWIEGENRKKKMGVVGCLTLQCITLSQWPSAVFLCRQFIHFHWVEGLE